MITTTAGDNIIFSLVRTGNPELLRFAVILRDRFLAADRAGHIGKMLDIYWRSQLYFSFGYRAQLLLPQLSEYILEIVKDG